MEGGGGDIKKLIRPIHFQSNKFIINNIIYVSESLSVRGLKTKDFYISRVKKPIFGPKETAFCPLYVKLCVKSRDKI